MFSTPFPVLCWIEHYSLWLNDIMPHASQNEETIGQKALANVRREMALPRVAQSAQKTIGDAATLSIPRRDSN
jgi:hypothetical protein